jgi:hypothetical protein
VRGFLPDAKIFGEEGGREDRATTWLTVGSEEFGIASGLHTVCWK